MSTKRKANATGNGKKVKKSKKKTTEGNEDDDDDEADDGGDDAAAAEPTAAQLQQANRPENQPDIETTRRKKRAKHQKVVATAKVDSAQRELLRNREYLRQWKTNRSAWKFEKLRQISVQNHLFPTGGDGERVDDEMWSMSLEYMSGTKGAGRQTIIRQAEEVIQKIDERIGDDGGGGGNELVRSQDYTRARELLQLLQ